MSIKNDTFAALRALNVAKVEITFSGGDDQGGPDSTTFVLNDSQTINCPWQMVWPERDLTPQETAINDYLDFLEAPIYERWGGFAGEFYVEGTLIWDVASETCRMWGTERVETYEDFS